MNITRHRTAVVASCNSGAACKCHDVLTYLVKANVPGCQHCTSAYLVCSVCAICISDVHTMFRDQCVTCCGRTLMIELAGASHRVEPATHLARTSQRHSLTPTSSSWFVVRISSSWRYACSSQMYNLQCRANNTVILMWNQVLEFLNPFKPSGVKWLHFKVFRAILV